jgi:hypothetical protein
VSGEESRESKGSTTAGFDTRVGDGGSCGGSGAWIEDGGLTSAAMGTLPRIALSLCFEMVGLATRAGRMFS